ncbi:MAG: glutathione-disulfide reductase [Alphaproteobacteria bacterium]
MAEYDYDLYVIGAGSGGVRASRIAAGYGAKVAVAEEYRVGGTCVIRGCVPKKLLAYAAHFGEDFEDAAGFGWEVGPRTHSWAKLIENKNKEIDRLNGIYIHNMKRVGVEIHDTRAVIKDAHTVHLIADNRDVTAKYILIATGAWPELPKSVKGIEHAVTSNEVFEMKELPKRIMVVGGGYIAVEFAGIFNGLGSKVVLSYRGPAILRGFDQDLRATLMVEMSKKGLDIQTETDVVAIEKRKGASGDVFVVQYKDGETVEVDLVMYATGRWPNTKGLGLENVGVAINDKGAIKVDEYSRTNVDNIYAVGDVTDRLNLTPVAIREGHAFADNIFGKKHVVVDHSNVPTAVFSNPPIGTVGPTEDEARKQYGEVDIYKTSFRPMKYTLSGRDERTVMKLIVDPKTDRVLACHIIGVDAPEMIQLVGIAVKMNATKADFDATVAVHPTAAEELVTMREKWIPPKE